MKKRITATTLVCLIQVILNTGCEDSCLGGCPDKPVATTIFDLQYIPEKEIYERTDTVLVKILHSNVGDVELEYNWILLNEIKLLTDSEEFPSQDPSKTRHKTFIDSIEVKFINTQETYTIIQLNINKKNHESAFFSKPIRIK